MKKEQLVDIIKKRNSFLCVGLDTDPSLLPAGVDMLEFNKRIVDATRDLCVAYKPNIAFYECLGNKGWDVLAATLEHIGKDHFTIADAKRGDIGNTSNFYAKTFFELYDFDSITVAPYMGSDSVKPFLSYTDKWTILLALTSNPGASDFQLFSDGSRKLFEQVLETSSGWGNDKNTMYVVGATRAEMLGEVRKIVPNHFLLVPGVGAQGGRLEEVSRFGMNSECGLLVNASRSILYASKGSDFEQAARNEAKKIQHEMTSALDRYLV